MKCSQLPTRTWVYALTMFLAGASFPLFSAQTPSSLQRSLQPLLPELQALLHQSPRTIDGHGNNESRPDWGRANTPIIRLAPQAYADGIEAPSGTDRPNPRLISNTVVDQPAPIWNTAGVSDLFWQWGQFLDHDLGLTPLIEPLEIMDIPVPAGDRFFDPFQTGSQVIHFERSLYIMVDGVREQINVNTAFIDASQVYGSDLPRAQELRTLDGTGRLKTSANDRLPFNVNGFFNFPVNDDPSFWLAGDVRASEQVGLTAMHTMFMREHNHWADAIAALIPDASGDQVYHLARRMVGAEMQCITYEEFLPILIGARALPPYRGYRADVIPAIATEFSTAAFRMGHTFLSPLLQRMDSRMRPTADGPLALRDAFFSPETFMNGGGVDPLIRGLASQTAQNVDAMVIDDIRNFLFGPPGSGGFDLASLNIQRGRDHGLPDYNAVRAALGLPPRSRMDEVCSDPEMQNRLQQAYATTDLIDLWVGGLAEDQMPGALLGETFVAVLTDQFTRLRDGDRFWYEHDLPHRLVQFINQQSLADIIRRNSGIGMEIGTKPLEKPIIP